VGTREHIVAYLAEVSELFDASGMASTKLAAAVGYPGSSVAFAQLLSGMERSGLIEREVRGKRTYRISLGQAQVGGPAGRAPGVGGPAGRAPGVGGSAGVDVATGVGAPTGGHGPGVGHGPGWVNGASGPGEANGSVPGFGAGQAGLDYDELARRLLAQVVRRLAGTQPDAEQPDYAALRERVASLECELAGAWTKHGKLAEENARLREQLQDTQRSLALARESLRRLPAADLDSAEVMLLQRLLAPAGDAAGLEDARPLGA
jgi:hypothetical protein